MAHLKFKLKPITGFKVLPIPTGCQPDRVIAFRRITLVEPTNLSPVRDDFEPPEGHHPIDIGICGVDALFAYPLGGARASTSQLWTGERCVSSCVLLVYYIDVLIAFLLSCPTPKTFLGCLPISLERIGHKLYPPFVTFVISTKGVRARGSRCAVPNVPTKTEPAFQPQS